MELLSLVIRMDQNILQQLEHGLSQQAPTTTIVSFCKSEWWLTMDEVFAFWNLTLKFSKVVITRVFSAGREESDMGEFTFESKFALQRFKVSLYLTHTDWLLSIGQISYQNISRRHDQSWSKCWGDWCHVYEWCIWYYWEGSWIFQYDWRHWFEIGVWKWDSLTAKTGPLQLERICCYATEYRTGWVRMGTNGLLFMLLW